MELYTKILLFISLIAFVIAQQPYVNGNNILDIDPPKFYIINPSPLRNPDSLRQQQYFSFLNTLYRHDRSKSNLFENISGSNNGYPLQNLRRQKRSEDPEETAPELVQQKEQTNRQRRAVVFRPLFVYRQQEVKRQRIPEEQRRYRHRH